MLGEAALIVFYTLLVSMLMFVGYKASTSPDLLHSPRARVRMYSTVLLGISLPFFIWAIINTAEDDSMDWGILTMGSVVLFASLALYLGPQKGLWASQWGVSLGCLAVAANFCYALYEVSNPAVFVVYASSGLIVYVLFWGLGLWLHRSLQDDHGSYETVKGGDEEDGFE